MSERIPGYIIKALQWLVGLALSAAVALGAWAYRDRVAYDERQDARIETVDRDLQSYKVKVAETLPDKQDLQDLRQAIRDLQTEVHERERR